MLLPDVFGENLFDNFFHDFPVFNDKEMQKMEKKLYGRRAGRLMKTDIRELDNRYEIEMDLPGFQKEEVKVFLENGYLTISAAKGFDKESGRQDEGHYIRKERCSGACSRSFYVGEAVVQEDVKAEFKHGILKLSVPKKESKPALAENNYIEIEG